MSTWHRGSPFRDGAPRETVDGEDLTALTEAPQPDPDDQRVPPVAVAPASISRSASGGPGQRGGAAAPATSEEHGA
jgi:hypothetical protein